MAKRNVEKNFDNGFSIRDLLSDEEKVVMKMIAGNRKYKFSKKEFEIGKRVFRSAVKVSDKELGKMLQNSCRKQWFDLKGNEISFFESNKKVDME